MSVVSFGVFVALIVGWILPGLILLFLGMRWFCARKSPHGSNLDCNVLPAEWLEAMRWLVAVLDASMASRAPPIGVPGFCRMVPIATVPYRRLICGSKNESV